MEIELSKFAAYLANKGYQKGTQRTILANISEFLRYNNCNLQLCFDHKYMTEFLSYLKTRPLLKKPGTLSANMIRSYRFAVRIFFKWAEIDNKLLVNPFDHLRFPSVPRKAKERVLEKSDILKLFDATKSTREKAMLHLFYSCGLRRTEVIKLNLNDVSINDRLVYIRCSKGKKRRVVPFTNKVAVDLSAYIADTLETRKGGSEAFMVTYSKKRMSSSTYYRSFRDILNRAGVEKGPLALHDLRSAVATHMLQEGMAMWDVMDFLGHSTLSSTNIYVKAHPSSILHL